MSTVEKEAEETSYTYLTLTKLKNRYPDTIFYFIMGADSLDYFEEWKHPEIICEKAVVLVAVRPLEYGGCQKENPCDRTVISCKDLSAFL